MSKTPAPRAGCFVVTYPNTVWKASHCVTAPLLPLLPSTVGNGYDEVAQSSTLIGSSFGSFQSVSGLVSETDSIFGADYYTLQDNTNFFTTSTPYTGSNSTTGWEQFVFANDPAFGGFVFIQYWLINYQSSYGSCPGTGPPGGSSWMAYQGSCYANSPGTVAPLEAASNLANLILKGYANFGSNDQAILCVSGGSCYTMAITAQVLNLYKNWYDAEFNVFGYGGGSQAMFNSGTSITVVNSLSDQNGNPIGPSCFINGYTGETNNLNLGACSSNSNGQIIFVESRTSLTYSVTFQGSGLTSGTAWGVTVGGQHFSATAPTSIPVVGLSGTVSYSYDSPLLGSGGSYSCTSSCSGQVSGAGTVTATYTFNPSTQTLTTGVDSGQGTVSPPCTSGCSEAVGSSLTVTATPSSGWQFSSWSTQSGINCGTNNPCNFNMPSNSVTLNATFTVPTVSQIAGFTSLSSGKVLLVVGDIAGNPHGLKPPGVGYQVGRDSTPLGFVSGMLVNAQPSKFDTNSAAVDSSGRPIGSWSIVFGIGGSDVDAVTHYYENTGAGADRAPVTFSVSGSNLVWTDRNGIVVLTVPQSSTAIPPGSSDVFVIQILKDSSGRLVVLLYGETYMGTWAAAWYLKNVVYPSISSYTNSYYIVRWTDATSGADADFVPSAGDTFTILAQGTP
jgi:hypothetical protein